MTEPDQQRCSSCGELRDLSEFLDGLRCVYCAEEQDADPTLRRVLNALASGRRGP